MTPGGHTDKSLNARVATAAMAKAVNRIKKLNQDKDALTKQLMDLHNANGLLEAQISDVQMQLRTLSIQVRMHAQYVCVC